MNSKGLFTRNTSSAKHLLQKFTRLHSRFPPSASYSTTYSSSQVIQLETDHSARNYSPLPVVFSKAKGVEVWDPEGKKYYDFLSGYSAVNQGHCHPKIIKALTDQASLLCLSSRAFYNEKLGPFSKYITEYFKYDRVLPMNTGAEAVETAIKLARKWGYLKKGIPENKAIIFACANNFHGRTSAAVAMSTDPSAYKGFGPYVPNVGPVCPITKKVIRHGNFQDLKEAIEAHHEEVAAFLVEPIQGEAGIIVPEIGYLKKCYELCKKHNILFIADEVQTGLCRTGKLLASDYDEFRPDVVLLGKALSGGTYPVSCVLADNDIMLCIKPGEHGSTFGGNPIACAVAIAALEVLKEENLAENALKMGDLFRQRIMQINNKAIQNVRGRGLLNAVVIDEDKLKNKTTMDLCLKMKENGLLAKPTQRNVIRFAPPLCITQKQIIEGIDVIEKSLDELTR